MTHHTAHHKLGSGLRIANVVIAVAAPVSNSEPETASHVLNCRSLPLAVSHVYRRIVSPIDVLDSPKKSSDRRILTSFAASSGARPRSRSPDSSSICASWQQKSTRDPSKEMWNSAWHPCTLPVGDVDTVGYRCGHCRIRIFLLSEHLDDEKVFFMIVEYFREACIFYSSVTRGRLIARAVTSVKRNLYDLNFGV
jgi:hypothetical protein